MLGPKQEAHPSLRSVQASAPARDGMHMTVKHRLRDECLNEHIFGNLAEARKIIENWRIDYHTRRPHTSLGGLSPAVFANLNRATRPASLRLRTH